MEQVRINGKVTHHGMIIHNDMSVTLVSGGSATWCYEQLVDYCTVHPLEVDDDAVVVERFKQVATEDVRKALQVKGAENGMLIVQMNHCPTKPRHAQHFHDTNSVWEFCDGKEVK